MGNSAVYLIHTSDDLGKVYAMAQHLATTLTVEMAAALRELPPMNAHVHPPDHPLPSTLADTFLALVNLEPAEISWMTCWPGVHHESGFQLGVNGAVLWHRPPPPGHSLYVHVPPAMPQLAEHLAAAVGGDILGEPAVGW